MKFVFWFDPEDIGNPWYPGASYAWISSQEFWDRHHCFDDTFRTSSIEKYHPDFQGSDDMEAHFEFPNKTFDELRAYLTGLGFTEVQYGS